MCSLPRDFSVATTRSCKSVIMLVCLVCAMVQQRKQKCHCYVMLDNHLVIQLALPFVSHVQYSRAGMVNML